ncbi:hypothetical protein [Komagataeibacter kakiaceti]|uniref:hypothetical protein n=1 Tax=Komagataeibacter kakiaceti TaxID=943261 RepID=UPI0024123AC0|nr:hypothetical protein [Komagataeibacter kakiaceti]
MKRELPEHFRSYKHVWVFIEFEHGRIHPVSLELLGEGRKLADRLEVELAAVIAGSGHDALEDVAKTTFSYGADLATSLMIPFWRITVTNPTPGS